MLASSAFGKTARQAPFSSRYPGWRTPLAWSAGSNQYSSSSTEVMPSASIAPNMASVFPGVRWNWASTMSIAMSSPSFARVGAPAQADGAPISKDTIRHPSGPCRKPWSLPGITMQSPAWTGCSPSASR